MADLTGKKVAILVDDNFENEEFNGPLKALKKAHATVVIVAKKAGKLQGMKNDIEPAETHQADRSIDDIRVDEFDALVLPGGTINADNLRTNDKAKLWIKNFMDKRKPVAAICHAPWALVSAGVTNGRRLTSFPSLQDDMRNSGATWVDEEVVVDGNLITSRNPHDIPAFNKALIAMLQAA